MAIVVARSIGQTQLVGGDSSAASFGSLPSAASHIVGVGASWTGGGGATWAWSDNQGGTAYTLAGEIATGGSVQGSASLRYRENISAPSGTFTVTANPPGTDNYIEWNAHEVSGLDTSTSIDGTGTASGSSTTPTVTASSATTQNNTITFGSISVDGYGETGGSALGIDELSAPWVRSTLQQNGEATQGAYAAYKINSATLTPNFNAGTMNNSHGWAAIVASFKSTGGAAATSLPISASMRPSFRGLIVQ